MVQEDSLKKIVVICGPTASGKTALALKIAKLLDTEIISADSIAVYKGLDVGTAKATKEERSLVPHDLIDVVEPTADYSVAEYERAALKEIERLHLSGKIPVICGGTGYFIDAILFKRSYGNCPKNAVVRKKLKERFETFGANSLYEWLRSVDPVTAEKLNPNDYLRVSRALEIFILTGKRKSEIVDEAVPRFRYVAFTIDYPRDKLYERINERVDKMFGDGLVAEVRGLLSSGVPENAQSMQAIGYKEIVCGIKDGLSIEEMTEAVKQNTRRYAKRQITYFKRLDGLNRLSGENAFEEAVKILKNERFIH